MSNKNQICSFRVHDLTLGIPAGDVREVIRAQSLTPVPLAPPSIPGLFNLRGHIVTTVDTRHCLDFPARGDDAPSMNVLVHSGDSVVSLLVDEIGDVIEVTESQFETAPDHLEGAVRDFVTGAYKLEEGLLLILAVDRMIEERAVRWQ